MRKPSIFNNEYHRIMRRRKIVFRTLITLIALAVIFFTYNKSAIPNLRKFAENLNFSSKNDVSQPKESTPGKLESAAKTGSDAAEQEKQEEQPKQEQVIKGEFTFRFPINESIAIAYEKRGNDSKITGIKPDNIGINYDISDDGKAIVFDNPRVNDIWIFNIDGSSRVLNSQSYISFETKQEFKKAEILERYEKKYIWAAMPKFLKDGRIVYQSNLPWFLEANTVYMWVVNSDGTDNRMFLPTKQAAPVKYSGYTNDGRLIIEFGGSKYTFSIEDRNTQKID